MPVLELLPQLIPHVHFPGLPILPHCIIYRLWLSLACWRVLDHVRTIVYDYSLAQVVPPCLSGLGCTATARAHSLIKLYYIENYIIF
jgi:hypothetical protein